MDQALLVQTATRNLRRKYFNDIAGLTAFADALACKTQGTAVTITQSNFQSGSGTGQITFAREIWLLAAEELLADPTFNAGAQPRPPRILTPDYRFCQAS